MGLWNMLDKAIGGLSNMGKEMQMCINAVEMANLSDDELKRCLNNASERAMLFSKASCENISVTIRDMAVRKVASDRGLI